MRSPHNLESVGDNAFVTTARSGNAVAAPASTLLKQGALESSNTDMSQAMTDMIEAQRTYQMTSKAHPDGRPDDGDRQRGQAMSISPISTASLPADIRTAGTHAIKQYKAALGFEQMLVGQLVKGMVSESSSLGEGPYASTMQDTLTSALVGGQGMGLARQIYKEMQS